MTASGFAVTGDGKGIAGFVNSRQSEVIVATQNKNALCVFTSAHASNTRQVPVEKTETKALIRLISGKTRLQEFYWGSTFVSQGARYLSLEPGVQEVILYDRNGKETRRIKP